MWLGSQQLLARLDIADVPVLSSTIRIQQSARDLGVVIDSRLSLSEHVASVCRSGYYQVRQLRQAVRGHVSCDRFHTDSTRYVPG